jgi:hypothetical protein
MILSQIAPILQKYERHLAAWAIFRPNQVARLEDEQVIARNLPTLSSFRRLQPAAASRYARNVSSAVFCQLNFST